LGGSGSLLFDDLTFDSGFQGTAMALVHDAGQIPQDSGLGNQWDNSTAAHTLTGSPTVAYNYADYSADQGWTAAQANANASWSADKTLAELQAVADTGLRYRYLRVKVAGDSGDTFDEFVMSTDNAVPMFAHHYRQQNMT
jgi:hypothetical protein